MLIYNKIIDGLNNIIKYKNVFYVFILKLGFDFLNHSEIPYFSIVINIYSKVSCFV